MLVVFFFLLLVLLHPCSLFFFFNDTATTEIYTLSLHDALPICEILFPEGLRKHSSRITYPGPCSWTGLRQLDRKSTRLNSSHQIISYAVFCLKKKIKNELMLLLDLGTTLACFFLY